MRIVIFIDGPFIGYMQSIHEGNIIVINDITYYNTGKRNESTWELWSIEKPNAKGNE